MTATRRIGVLHVVPATSKATAPIFVTRQVAGLPHHVVNDWFFFKASESSISKILASFIRLRRQIKTSSPDVVHAHWGGALGFLTCLASLGVGKVVVTYRGSDLNPTPSDGFVISTIRRLLSQMACLLADFRIYVSEPLREQSIFQELSYAIIADGINLNEVFPVDFLEARRLTGWSVDARIVLFYAGKTPAVKRLDLAEIAVSLLEVSGTAVELYVVTTGIDISEMNLLINSADCLLICSDYEGSPNVVREAISVGTPVVGVDVGDVASWISRSGKGAIVGQSANAIAAGLKFVLDTADRDRRRPNFVIPSVEQAGKLVAQVYEKIT